MGTTIIAIFSIFCSIVYLIVSSLEAVEFDETEWEEATALYTMTLEEALLIIDDAECNGFMVKRVGTKIYFKEI